MRRILTAGAIALLLTCGGDSPVAPGLVDGVYLYLDVEGEPRRVAASKDFIFTDCGETHNVRVVGRESTDTDTWSFFLNVRVSGPGTHPTSDGSTPFWITYCRGTSNCWGTTAEGAGSITITSFDHESPGRVTGRFQGTLTGGVGFNVDRIVTTKVVSGEFDNHGEFFLSQLEQNCM